MHCVWVAADMYSAPSIVLQSRRQDGGVHVFDDFREAYAWLRHNTDPNTKVSVLGCAGVVKHCREPRGGLQCRPLLPVCKTLSDQGGTAIA